MTSVEVMPKQFISVDGIRVATRADGSGPPLVLLHRFRGTMDDWDPALISALATQRKVITFDSVGIGETAGAVPDSVEAMADFAAAFIEHATSGAVDILGWSLGGFVAQLLAIKHPGLVRRLVLAGTMPPGGPGLEWSADWLTQASAPVPTAENALALLYRPSQASRNAGLASLGRLPHPPAAYASAAAVTTQARVITRFASGEEGSWTPRLGEIAVPTFVANGDRDELFPAIDSLILARQIHNSRVAIYPDSGHAFLFQYAERFTEDVLAFLEAS